MFRSMFVNPKYNNNQIKFLYDKIIHEAKKVAIPEFTMYNNEELFFIE